MKKEKLSKQNYRKGFIINHGEIAISFGGLTFPDI
jgi:hypothetical protein